MIQDYPKQQAQPEASRSSRNRKIAALVLAALCLAGAHHAGLFHVFAEAGRAKSALGTLGPWGYLAYVLAYAALQPFGVPGTVFVVVASMIWPWPLAFALSMTGSMAASVVGFSFARFVARDWVSERVPLRFRAYEKALDRRGFVTVLALRLVFWMQPMLHAFFGISNVRFWTHFWGSILGYFFPLLLISWLGDKGFVMLRDAPAVLWIAAGLAIACLAGAAWALRRWSNLLSIRSNGTGQP